MRFRNYLITEKVQMPERELDRFKDIIEEFFVEYPNYKYVTPEKFLKDLERFDYKSLSVLLGNLKVKSIDQFIHKYQHIINTMHESVYTD